MLTDGLISINKNKFKFILNRKIESPYIKSSVRNFDGSQIELYDLEKDPGETKNLAANIAYRDVCFELLDKIILRSIAVIADHRCPDGTIDADEISDTCAELSVQLRTVLDRTADLVNHGYAPPLETPQNMADRILGAKSNKSTGA